LRGYYHGVNVSYNIKKMVENGYLVQERSVQDRRVVFIRATTKGNEEVRYKLNKRDGGNLDSLHQIGITRPIWQQLC
jgi:DNA-binding MarR family transcriptional regulator